MSTSIPGQKEGGHENDGASVAVKINAWRQRADKDGGGGLTEGRTAT
jgi:hypothetical protein